MTTDIAAAVRTNVPSISHALQTLVAMEKELTTAKTYDEIRRVIQEASALKVLLGHVDEVKAQAEDTILVAHARIGEEQAKVPKAKPGPQKIGSQAGTEPTGKAATGIPKTNRHRNSKLATAGISAVKATAAKLREEGKDATPRAVATELTHGDKAERRANRQTTLAEKIKALPDKRYGVIYGDPGWKTETYSDKGLDRSADNFYTTESLDKIKALDVPSICAAATVLFMWVTVPHLEQGLEVVRHWGFTYKSMLTWDKETIGTGHWLRNQTEHLIIATKGKVVAPGDDQKISSLYRERKTEHSVKPDGIAAWIERLYPDIPKIELNRRGPARPGWEAWGNEAEQQEDAA